MLPLSVQISVVIPTLSRAAVLRRTLENLAAQSVQPDQIIIVDASPDRSTFDVCIATPIEGLLSKVEWYEAETAGAAVQRNQAFAHCRHDVIGFFDDDILFESDCMARLWAALQSDPGLGGVNAMITNQQYHPPGAASRLMFRLLAGSAHKSYAGLVLGPAVQLLPENNDDLPNIVPTEWLNSTATLYRREAMPNPPFERFFTGYSLMEDLALSLIVGRGWKLVNVRNAQIFHDSQPGLHKSDSVALSKMELVNRHYVMTRVLRRDRVTDYGKLALWEAFQLFSAAIHSRGGREFWQMLYGKFKAVLEIAGGRDRRHRS